MREKKRSRPPDLKYFDFETGVVLGGKSGAPIFLGPSEATRGRKNKMRSNLVFGPANLCPRDSKGKVGQSRQQKNHARGTLAKRLAAIFFV